MLTVNVEAEFDPAILEDAVEHLERAVAGSPDHMRYRRVLGEAYLAQRHWEKALEELQVVHKAEGNARTAYLMAYAYYRLDARASAEKYLNQAGEMDTLGFTKLHLLRGRIFHDDQRYGEAVNEFSKALILTPDAPVASWFMARSLVAHAQETEESVGLYRRALKILSGITPTVELEDEWNALIGRVYLALLYPVEALRHLENSRFGSEHEKLLLMGIAYLLKGNFRDARKWLAMAVAEPKIRSRCEQYLTEIACAPEGALTAMDPSISGGVAQSFPDVDLLVGVFGPGAEEIDRILEASRRGRTEEIIRTRVDSSATGSAGRLFAAFDSLDDDTKPDDPALAPRPVFDDEEATVVSDLAGDAVETRRDPVDPARLFPGTWVDLSDEIAQANEATIRQQKPSAGGDVAAGVRKGDTATMKIPEEDIPDLEFPELDDLDDPDEESRS